MIRWQLRNNGRTPAPGRQKRRLREPAEISLLDRLRAEVERAGLHAEPAPDRTALLVYRPGAPLPIWVFVGGGGARFCWAAGQKAHPVSDIDGAVAALLAYASAARQREAAR